MSEKTEKRVDEEAAQEDFTQLHERCYHRVVSFLYRMTNDSVLAEDLAQETFMVAFTKLPAPRGKSPSLVWLFSIAKNLAMNKLRVSSKQGAEPLSQQMADFGPETTAYPAEAPSAGESREETELKGKARIEPEDIDVLLQRLSGEPTPTDEARLIEAIDLTLGKIEQARLESRSHDQEIVRLGEETRRLIGEMQRDLNLKAA